MHKDCVKNVNKPPLSLFISPLVLNNIFLITTACVAIRVVFQRNLVVFCQFLHIDVSNFISLNNNFYTLSTLSTTKTTINI